MAAVCVLCLHLGYYCHCHHCFSLQFKSS